jgi:hypothetical protein
MIGLRGEAKVTILYHLLVAVVTNGVIAVGFALGFGRLLYHVATWLENGTAGVH